MFICYYFFNLLRDYKGKNDTFLTLLVICKHAVTEEDKIFINNLFDLKGHNGRHLVREFLSKSWNAGLVYQCRCKSYGSTIVPAADDAKPHSC